MSHTSNSPGLFNILHFNDAYNLAADETSDPVGGAARCKTVIEKYRRAQTIITFGGDCFNPSPIVDRGQHMVPVLNGYGVDIAVIGNHDFDHGNEQTNKLIKSCSFPWLLSNLQWKNGEQIVSTQKFKLIDRRGIKIGFMGLIEEAWLGTLAIRTNDFVYTDFIETAKILSQELREKGADMIVALTHMRVNNDKKLAENVSEIDLILGGHDHFHVSLEIRGTPIVKSGCEFKYITNIEVFLPRNGQWNKPKFQMELIPISRDILPDKEIQQLVEFYESQNSSLEDNVIGYITEAVDLLSSTIRMKENSFGNLVCDIVNSEFGTDCTIINSGSFRSDRVWLSGAISLKTLKAIFPFKSSSILVVTMKGKILLEMLEHGFSAYPSQEGRFPQISGIRLIVDASAQPNRRISQISINGNPLDLNEDYKIAFTNYMYGGGDDFNVCKKYQLTSETIEGVSIIVVLQNGFGRVPVCSPKIDGRINIINSCQEGILQSTSQTLTRPKKAVEL